MPDSEFFKRISDWRRHLTWKKLLWFIPTFVWEAIRRLVEDRVVGGTNSYLDKHSNSVLASLAHGVQFFFTHPVSAAAIIAIACLVVLLCHAYWETRPSRLKPEQEEQQIAGLRGNSSSSRSSSWTNPDGSTHLEIELSRSIDCDAPGFNKGELLSITAEEQKTDKTTALYREKAELENELWELERPPKGKTPDYPEYRLMTPGEFEDKRKADQLRKRLEVLNDQIARLEPKPPQTS